MEEPIIWQMCCGEPPSHVHYRGWRKGVWEYDSSNTPIFHHMSLYFPDSCTNPFFLADHQLKRSKSRSKFFFCVILYLNLKKHIWKTLWIPLLPPISLPKSLPTRRYLYPYPCMQIFQVRYDDLFFTCELPVLITKSLSAELSAIIFMSTCFNLHAITTNWTSQVHFS